MQVIGKSLLSRNAPALRSTANREPRISPNDPHHHDLSTLNIPRKRLGNPSDDLNTLASHRPRLATPNPSLHGPFKTTFSTSEPSLTDTASTPAKSSSAPPPSASFVPSAPPSASTKELNIPLSWVLAGTPLKGLNYPKSANDPVVLERRVSGLVMAVFRQRGRKEGG